MLTTRLAGPVRGTLLWAHRLDDAWVEPALLQASAGDTYQFERTGYFITDGTNPLDPDNAPRVRPQLRMGRMVWVPGDGEDRALLLLQHFEQHGGVMRQQGPAPAAGALRVELAEMALDEPQQRPAGAAPQLHVVRAQHAGLLRR